MKYERIIRKLTAEPWLILESGHDAILQLVESKLTLANESKFLGVHAARPKEDLFGEPIEQMQIDPISGIATIPVKGVIGAGLGHFEKSCGACDTQDVSDDLQTALERGAKSAILDIESPGGTVGGTPELADQIERVQDQGLNVYAFTSGMMASAAYWIGSSARGGVFATRSAEVGSIGVYQPFIDRAKRIEAMGYRIEIFKAGKFKAMGYPGTSLNDEQRGLLQEQVDEIYSQFAGHVQKMRPSVKSEAMQGQTFMGEKAEKQGLIDGIVTGIKEIKDMLTS